MPETTPPPVVISKAAVMLRLQEIEKEVRDLLTLVENADWVDDQAEKAVTAVPAQNGGAS
jgi:hypothetical protein